MTLVGDSTGRPLAELLERLTRRYRSGELPDVEAAAGGRGPRQPPQSYHDALGDLAELGRLCEAGGYGQDRIRIDRTVVRGLEYYTGPVFEAEITIPVVNEDGQIDEAHSISAGLDYPGIGPEHSWLHEIGRVKYLSATDDEGLAAFLAFLRDWVPERFAELAVPYVKQVVSRDLDVGKLLALIQPRIEKFSQIPQQISFFETLPDFDCELFVNKGQKASIEGTKQILPAAIDVLQTVETWNNDTLFAELKTLSASLGLKAGSVMWAVRIAVSGTSVTPGGATEILAILGKQESLRRLKFSLDKVSANVG